MTAIDSPYLTTKECAAYTRRTVASIANALRAGELRGAQPTRKGKWLVHRDDLDAWMRGENTAAPEEPAQAVA
jgi:excisionase family DNA binding protein